jgi:hypothetical protein
MPDKGSVISLSPVELSSVEDFSTCASAATGTEGSLAEWGLTRGSLTPKHKLTLIHQREYRKASTPTPKPRKRVLNKQRSTSRSPSRS